MAIRAALAGLGLPDSVWGSVRPMVTHSGTYTRACSLRTRPAKIAESQQQTQGAEPAPVE